MIRLGHIEPIHAAGLRRRRGTLTIEAIIGIIILSVMLTLVMVAVVQRNRALQRLADVRDMVRRNENALLALQAGQPTGDAGVTVRKLAKEPPAAGWVWVEVSISKDGHRTALTGLAPTAAATREEAAHGEK
jgi:hypothetical protein